jgi:hypothetical protein
MPKEVLMLDVYLAEKVNSDVAKLTRDLVSLGRLVESRKEDLPHDLVQKVKDAVLAMGEVADCTYFADLKFKAVDCLGCGDTKQFSMGPGEMAHPCPLCA